MPTGYTSELHDGEQTFTDFVLTCARGMGALITMRDEPMDAPIPDEFTPSMRYYLDSKASAEARLEALRAMTPEDIFRANQNDRAAVLAERAKEAVKRHDMRKRYEAMVAQVEAWEPPTEDHVGLKKFMLEQLHESIRFDCGDVSWPPMPAEDPAEWFEAEIAQAERDIAYAD